MTKITSNEYLNDWSDYISLTCIVAESTTPNVRQAAIANSTVTITAAVVMATIIPYHSVTHHVNHVGMTVTRSDVKNSAYDVFERDLMDLLVTWSSYGCSGCNCCKRFDEQQIGQCSCTRLLTSTTLAAVLQRYEPRSLARTHQPPLTPPLSSQLVHVLWAIHL